MMSANSATCTSTCLPPPSRHVILPSLSSLCLSRSRFCIYTHRCITSVEERELNWKYVYNKQLVQLSDWSITVGVRNPLRPHCFKNYVITEPLHNKINTLCILSLSQPPPMPLPATSIYTAYVVRDKRDVMATMTVT